MIKQHQVKTDIDAEIDDWKRSEEFDNLPHGEELLADFEDERKGYRDEA